MPEVLQKTRPHTATCRRTCLSQRSCWRSYRRRGLTQPMPEYLPLTALVLEVFTEDEASHGHSPEDLRPCAASADTRKSPESAASTRSRAMKALTGSPTSTTKRLTTASHGPNALVWKRQPCAFRRSRLVHRKLCCIKFRTSQRLPEPSEDSLQMLGTQREKTSTVKARLTTLSRMVAIAPMAKTKRYREGAVSSGPISSSSL